MTASASPLGDLPPLVSLGGGMVDAAVLEDGGRRLAKLDKQISARSRALPLFRSVVESDDLAPALRSQRQHPVHTLLRRLYHES